MKRTILLILPLLFGGLVAMGGCHTEPCPVAPSSADAAADTEAGSSDLDGVTSPLGQACEHLRALGCPEGDKDSRTARTCYQRLRAEADLAVIPVDCLKIAHTTADVRTCGSKDTIRFRCIIVDGGR